MRTVIAIPLIAFFTAGVATAGNYGNDTGKDIVAVAHGAGIFTTLAAALKAAGLFEAVQGEGPFTVFAPTGEAFAKLPAPTLAALLKDLPKLKEIPPYHVVPGKVTAAQVVSLSKVATLQGAFVNNFADSGDVKINNARVITTDIWASNRVIHRSDTVILPPAR